MREAWRAHRSGRPSRRIHKRTIETLAEMICGGSGGMTGYAWSGFPYRSSSQLSRFFGDCDLPYSHDGSTRKSWAESVLQELNGGPSISPQLPADGIIRVIQELMAKDRFAADVD